jgi:ammonium transporter
MNKTRLLALLAPCMLPAVAMAGDSVAIDSGDTAWMLTSALLVILMSLPGLALFYGGLVRAKNMASILTQVVVIFSLISVLWVVYGYSLTFGGAGKFFANLDFAFLRGISPDTPSSALPNIPEFVWVAFQNAFASLTVALTIGAFAERIKFSAVLIFSVIWFTLCYVPVAHMIWGGGLLADDGALDFAGGTVIHLNAGIAGLVGAYFLGKRRGLGRESFAPHSLVMTTIGGSLLWVGWFGFNAGSAGAANGIAGLAFVNTILATSVAVLGWIATEKLMRGKSSLLGAVSGAIAGLVGITPAAGFVGPFGAIVIGAICGPACVWGVTQLKRWLNADDACDVFGIHGVAGLIGAVLTGVFVAPSLGGVGVDEYNMAYQVWIQIKGALITMVLSALVTVIGFWIADKLVGVRVSEQEEREGLDISTHGESAYHP